MRYPAYEFKQSAKHDCSPAKDCVDGRKSLALGCQGFAQLKMSSENMREKKPFSPSLPVR